MPSAKFFLYFLPAILASLAFMTGFLFSFWCESVQFLPLDSGAGVNPIQLGPWYQRAAVSVSSSAGGGYTIETWECADLPSGMDVDAKLKTVRAFTILTPLLSGLLVCALWFAPCCPGRASASSWKSMAIFFSVILTLFQGLTFLILPSSFCQSNASVGSQNGGGVFSSNCQWDNGSTANVVSVVCYFLTGLIMLGIGAPPARTETPPPETQAVTYEKTVNPDGTTTVAETTVVMGAAVTE